MVQDHDPEPTAGLWSDHRSRNQTGSGTRFTYSEIVQTLGSVSDSFTRTLFSIKSPREGPGVGPDVGSGVGPDVGPGVGPGVGPDVAQV